MGGEGDCIFDPAKYRRAPVFKQQFLSNLPPFYDPQANVYGVISAGFIVGQGPYSSGESLADEEQMANFRYRITPDQTINVYGGGPVGAAPLVADLGNMLLEDLANAAYLESLEQNVHVDIYYSIYWGKGYRVPGMRVENLSSATVLVQQLKLLEAVGGSHIIETRGDEDVMGLPLGYEIILSGEAATIELESPASYFQPGLFLDLQLSMKTNTTPPIPMVSSWRIWEWGEVAQIR
jgi:hypothetical protein